MGGSAFPRPLGSAPAYGHTAPGLCRPLQTPRCQGGSGATRLVLGLDPRRRDALW